MKAWLVPARQKWLVNRSSSRVEALCWSRPCLVFPPGWTQSEAQQVRLTERLIRGCPWSWEGKRLMSTRNSWRSFVSVPLFWFHRMLGSEKFNQWGWEDMPCSGADWCSVRPRWSALARHRGWSKSSCSASIPKSWKALKRDNKAFFKIWPRQEWSNEALSCVKAWLMKAMSPFSPSSMTWSEGSWTERLLTKNGKSPVREGDWSCRELHVFWSVVVRSKIDATGSAIRSWTFTEGWANTRWAGSWTSARPRIC